MEYQVPQFIEVESKIVGPLTLRQFIYIAGTVGLCVVFFVYLPLIFAIILAAPVIGLGASLAFYKVNGKSFIDVLEAGFNYYTGSKLFLWERKIKPEKHTAPVQAAPEAPKAAPRLTSGKLSDLAWSLDMQSHDRELGKTPAKPE